LDPVVTDVPVKHQRYPSNAHQQEQQLCACRKSAVWNHRQMICIHTTEHQSTVTEKKKNEQKLNLRQRRKGVWKDAFNDVVAYKPDKNQQ
jgi:hypothetical protein